MPRPFVKRMHKITAPFEMTQRLSTIEMSVMQGLMRGLSAEEMAGTYGRKPKEIDTAWRSLCKRFDVLPERPSQRTLLVCRAFEYGVLLTRPVGDDGDGS